MAPSLAAVPHPRLFLVKDGFEPLRIQVRDDAPSRRIAECLRRKAERFCQLPVNQRVLNGTRLLSVARSCLERILPLALMARLDGNERYAQRAADEMLAAAAFTDWNPAHFLDTAELTFALGTGYDWLYDLLTESQRDTVATAIVEKGLKPSFQDPAPWWVTSPFNWNQVCHAGLCVGALAVAEREPELAARILARAVTNVPTADAEYEPDGAYVEGTMYWGYGTTFQIALSTALKSATGDDHGLADNAGFLASAHYIRQMQGPGGKLFNYSDSNEKRDFQPPLLWFAQRLHEPAVAEAELCDLDRFLTGYEAMESHLGYRLVTLALLWRQVPEKLAPAGTVPPCHWHGLGQTPVAVHRSAWDDPQATFVAIKGGSPSAPHGHMDAGNFVLEAGGVRWASDLGGQDYLGLEQASVDLWNARQSGGRWTVFRLGSQGHSVLSFNGAQQLVKGNAPIVRFADERHPMPHTVIDLSTVYADHVKRAWRGVGLLPDGRVVLQDEWSTGNLAVEVRWQMLTFAQVTVDEAKKRFLLGKGGQRLELRLDSVDGATEVKLSVEEKSQPVHPYDATNPKLSMLVLSVNTEALRSGSLRLVAALPGVADAAVPLWKPLAEWSAGS